MFQKLKIIVMGLALTASIPVALAAQQDDGRGPVAVPAEAQQLILEMQQIQSQLRPMQQQALQDPVLLAAGDSLGARIREAMIEVEPATPTLIERLNELMGQAEAAQDAQDEPRFNEIIREAADIDQLLQIAQSEAIELPDVAERVQAYEARVHQKMISDNPQAATLLARLDELSAELSAVFGSTP